MIEILPFFFLHKIMPKKNFNFKFFKKKDQPPKLTFLGLYPTVYSNSYKMWKMPKKKLKRSWKEISVLGLLKMLLYIWCGCVVFFVPKRVFGPYEMMMIHQFSSSKKICRSYWIFSMIPGVDGVGGSDLLMIIDR